MMQEIDRAVQQSVEKQSLSLLKEKDKAESKQLDKPSEETRG